MEELYQLNRMNLFNTKLKWEKLDIETNINQNYLQLIQMKVNFTLDVNYFK